LFIWFYLFFKKDKKERNVMRFVWSRVSIVFALLTLFLLSACGGSGSSNASSTSAASGNTASVGVLDPNKKYSIDFWEAFAAGANKTTLEKLTQQYMQAHPNVTVKLTPYDSYNTLSTKLTASIAAGKTPALAQVYENWATKFQQADALASLQPFISGKNGLSQSDIADFFPAMWSDGQIDGTQYMLPFNKSDIVLYYNADMLQKDGLTPPATLQDLKDDMTKATQNGQWGLSYTPDVDLWSILYKDDGGSQFVSQDGKSAAFGSSANANYAKQALGDFVPLVKSGAIHITNGYAWENDFVSQKSLFAISSVASYSFLKDLIKGSFQFSEAPMPKGPVAQSTVLFGTNLSIFSKADADSQNAAWDYMKFLTSTQVNATFVGATGYMPVRQSAYAASAIKSDATRKAGPDSVSFSFVAAIQPAWSICRDVISSNFTSALRSQLTPDAALTKMTQECTSDLSQD
jgi:multiple sugar transport system substrate-binding protein